MDVDRDSIDEPDGSAGHEISPPCSRAAVNEQIRPALLSVLVLTVLSGVVFPLLLFAIARPWFPRQAHGSLIRRGGAMVGSDLIGQEFQRPEYFQSRPSAAGSGYDATASGGTNLGPDNPKLVNGSADFAGIQQLAEEYRERNGLASDVLIPIDAVTRSGSGLDPHISLANALLQVPRIARARRLSEESIRRLVIDHLEGRQFGFLGSPRVSVLALNLALDQQSGDREIR
ncbi:MAG: potassium-transporting ATPase subunit KdpC [Terriglobia bacterium]